MNLVARVKAILLTPKTEWPVIESEPGDAKYLFTNYVAILAAIPAIAGFIGMSLIGFTVPTVGTIRLGIGMGILNAVLTYVMAFVMSYVVALIADGLAPTFGGSKNFESALKLTVYSMTAWWVAGIFLIIPSLAFLAILGLRSTCSGPAHPYWRRCRGSGRSATPPRWSSARSFSAS